MAVAPFLPPRVRELGRRHLSKQLREGDGEGQVGPGFPDLTVLQPSPHVERDGLSLQGPCKGRQEVASRQIPLSRKMGKGPPFLLSPGSQSTTFSLCLRAQKSSEKTLECSGKRRDER